MAGDAVAAEQRYYTARKFLLSVGAIGIATALRYFDLLSAQLWADVTVYSLAVFSLADVGQKAVDAWSGARGVR